MRICYFALPCLVWTAGSFAHADNSTPSQTSSPDEVKPPKPAVLAQAAKQTCEEIPILAQIGSYECVALLRAAERRALTLDAKPAGKKVRTIHVYNHDVFGEDESWLTWSNIFHVTTREYVIRREVLLRPGELWDEEKIAETRRNLREPLFCNLVVIAPVMTPDPTKVDLLVVTRDVWSLRLNSRYEFQEGTLTDLSLSISENNFFGLRKQLAAVFEMNQSVYSFGPQIIDKNIGGSHLTFIGRAGAMFGRNTNDFEGTFSNTKLEYPFWNLDRHFGAAITEEHFDGLVRRFRGNELLLRDNPQTEEIEMVPDVYDYWHMQIETKVTLSLGKRIKHRLSLGHRFNIEDPKLTGNSVGDPAAAFILPRHEQSSSLFTRYAFFTPTYAEYRNINSYDLSEDVQLGPQFFIETGLANELFLSDDEFGYGSAGVGWTFDIGGNSVLNLLTSVSTRLTDGDFSDEVWSGGLFFASPPFAEFARLVMQATASGKWNDTSGRIVSLGGQNGLRGFTIGSFVGTGSFLSNIEVRTLPTKIWFMRGGLVAFWDAGHAADSIEEIHLHHDVGLGVRLLVPQLQPFVFRFDWAFPLNGDVAALPGRFSAGAQQVF